MRDFACWPTQSYLDPRGLERDPGGLAPPDGKDVAVVERGPVVERALPPVELDVDEVALHLAHGGAADQVRVLPVDGLELHADGEGVALGRGRLGLEAGLGREGGADERLGEEFGPGGCVEGEAHRRLQHPAKFLKGA